MSFGGGKLKPEDLFHSLSVISKETNESTKSVGQKFFDKFRSKFTEEVTFGD